jgi:TonB family protein
MAKAAAPVMTKAATSTVLYRVYELPWSTGADQDLKFRKTVRASLAALLVLALVIAILPVPPRDSTYVPEVPKRLAKLVLERKAPPPPVVEKAPEPKPEPVEQKQVREEPKPKPSPEPQPEKPAERPLDRTQQARERAKVAGLLPFTQQLAALRDESTVERLDRTQVAGKVEGASPLAERSLITSRVGTASGGINTAALSRNTGGGGLSERATTKVESPVAAVGVAGGGAAQRSGESNKASRSREEIERVFDLNKGSIYTLYNRALRRNPTLQGKLVLRLTIAPDGRVTSCEVVSSELMDPELEQKLVQRVMLFQFEPRDVETITTTKPIDFFPA